MVKKKTAFRVNTLKSDREEVLSQLALAGISVEPLPWSDIAFTLNADKEETLRSLPIYAEGKIYLQSPSSMLPPIVLQPNAGEDLLDMAAAPGGKTTQMAALTGGKAFITACEKDKVRAERLKYNLFVQGASRVSVLVQDAKALSDFLRFDRILLDAPCSGSSDFVIFSF
ncbi:MAG: RsmB/NOP family class I SAM-dependent RNA methyltransferase [Clostridia bacterium]|nr:RsmB/NOP family class I SAM-dependent RNA methyltransferase [Clostridia bacterium]